MLAGPTAVTCLRKKDQWGPLGHLCLWTEGKAYLGFIVLGQRWSLSSVAAKGRLDPGMVVIDNQSGYENENGRHFPVAPYRAVVLKNVETRQDS